MSDRGKLLAELEFDVDGLCDFDGFAVQHGGAVLKLNHRLARRHVEKRITAKQLQILHRTIFGDRRLEVDNALCSFLHGRWRIDRLNLVNQDRLRKDAANMTGGRAGGFHTLRSG